MTIVVQLPPGNRRQPRVTWWPGPSTPALPDATALHQELTALYESEY